MTNPEQAIDKLMSGLRNAEARPGMDRRILEALDHHASAPTTLHRSPALRWPVTAGALAFALVLMLTVSAMHHTAQSPTHPPSPEFTVNQESTPEAPVPIAQRPVRHRARRVQLTSPLSSLAEQEMRAASLPAPPLPLTRQEKLLLRIAHTNDPIELAALDPLRWAAKDAEDKAKFDRFFAPPQRTPQEITNESHPQ